jgi:hypothetical protein
MVTAGIVGLCVFLFGLVVVAVYFIGLSLPLLAYYSRQVFNLRGLVISAVVAGILLLAVRQLVRSEPEMPRDSRATAPARP